jgi:transcriptional regulator with GAF, ATPase, and Fis domain
MLPNLLPISFRKGLLVLSGVLSCGYAVCVLLYVQAMPDVGLRCAFSPEVDHVEVNRVFPGYLRTRPQPIASQAGGVPHEPESEVALPAAGDVIVQVGDRRVSNWPRLLRALIDLGHETPTDVADLADAERKHLTSVSLAGEHQVFIQFWRPAAGPGEPGGLRYGCWWLLGRLPVEELTPSILWFALKVGLFVVGALVFWKRPEDNAAAQFFLLSIVAVGAYMGGYHWARIATQPALLLVFMVCGVLLPAVSLHFYLLFPKPRGFLLRYPLRTLLVLYGPPLAFLAALAVNYLRVRGLVRGGSPDVEVVAAWVRLRTLIAAYFLVAALWYLASIACLLHSYRAAADATERNQVKWILFGSLGALVPIGYTLYLAFWQREAFGAGQATWPMFAASVCFTVAFAVSITRYRLLQLDEIVSRGAIYFVLAGLVYYAVVFIGMSVASLVGGQVIAGTSLAQTLWVSATALVLMLLLNVVQGRVKKALDRRFDRQKHQLDRTLRRMGQAIEQLVDPPTLARRLLQASADLLSFPRGAVYLREGEPPLYRLAGALGPVPPPLVELPPGCPLVEALRARKAVTLRPGDVSEPAVRQLQFLGGEVAYALAHEGNLLAFLVLGPKDAGPYGVDDLNLLAAFAQLTALALESAQGHRTIEFLNRDLRGKVEKISEQQRRILALQNQLTKGLGRSEPAGDRPRAEAPGRNGATPPAADPFQGIIGSSPALRRLLEMARKVSATQSTVLIRGESGTGKELLARALHENSARAGKAYVKVHCAALSPSLLESELFGHVKGAFTGSHADKVGRFEMADGGTLFLDEIGDVSLDVQTKLLRVLQEKMFERVGSSAPVRVDVRVIAATHQNLEVLIRQGRFREDLYYRLNVIEMTMPPLRERREDITELAQHFLRLYTARCGKAVTEIEDDALAILKGYRWPGNIRELENKIERAVVVAEGLAIRGSDLPPDVILAQAEETDLMPDDWPHDSGPLPPGLGVRAERAERGRRERERLVRALAAANGNKAEAARALGLARSTLVSRLKKYGLS